MKPRALVSWSGGKDAAWAFHRVRDRYEITGLLTTFSQSTAEVPVHNVPVTRVAAQANALRLPLMTVPLPRPCPNADYQAALDPIWSQARNDGVEAIVFGDLFLADIRRYRERLLSTTGLKPVFPLWGELTALLAREMICGGLDSTLCAAQNPSLIGRPFDLALLEQLPPDADPCGENGEFHTFVHYMPGFSVRVS